MKPWSAYEVDDKKFPYPSQSGHRKTLQQQLDSQLLTKSDREEAEKGLDRLAREWFNEEVKPYNTERRRLTESFWQDAKTELGYETYLNENQISLLESTAYNKGHAYGFSSVYEELANLNEFLTELFSRQTKVDITPRSDV